jgi:hypothetical protein
MNSTVQSLLVSFAIVLGIVIGIYFAYNAGLLDPVIEKIGVYLFKAKAMAEKKKLQAQGMKAGEDFVGGKSEYVEHTAPRTRMIVGTLDRDAFSFGRYDLDSSSMS